jgi:hypothetical protein
MKPISLFSTKMLKKCVKLVLFTLQVSPKMSLAHSIGVSLTFFYMPSVYSAQNEVQMTGTKEDPTAN